MLKSDTAPWLSVIIPAYNEERRLPATLEKILAYLASRPFSHDVWVVDNGSTDRTAEVVRDYMRRYPSLRLEQIPVRGKGVAVRTGMLRAKGAFRFLCDADLSMPVEEFDRFYPPALEDADVAIGSREVPGARRFDEPSYRHLTGRVFSFAVKLARDARLRGYAVRLQMLSRRRRRGSLLAPALQRMVLRRGGALPRPPARVPHPRSSRLLVLSIRQPDPAGKRLLEYVRRSPPHPLV